MNATVQHENIGERKVSTAKGERRGEVSSEWMGRPDDQRFTSLIDLRDHVQRWRDLSEEVVRSVTALSFDHETTSNDLVFRFDGQPLEPTPWAFDQIATTLGTPRDYMRRLVESGAADLAALCLTQGVVERGGREVMLYKTETELRAVTSASYGRIHDVEIANALVDLAGTGAGEMR